jgi:hypothetical protein
MIDEETLRMVIRATARLSAVCIALAFAKIRTRTFLRALPVSHGLHFAAILTLAFTTTAANAHIGWSSFGGAAIYALMLFAAVRPESTGAIYLLWIIFLIGFVVRDLAQPVYIAVLTMLAVAGAVRAMRTRFAHAAVPARR